MLLRGSVTKNEWVFHIASVTYIGLCGANIIIRLNRGEGGVTRGLAGD